MLVYHLLPLIALAASQCMQVKRGMRRCQFDAYNLDTSILLNTSITQCMEDCLISRKAFCYYIQWNAKTRNCFKSNSKYFNHRREGDCITMERECCYAVQDSSCLKEERGLEKPERGTSFQMIGIENEEACRDICLFSEPCGGYIWNQEETSCNYIEHGIGRFRRKPKKGDVKMIKPTYCTKGPRCVLLVISANAPRGQLERSAYTLNSCLKISLKDTQIYMADWNYNRRTCWLHNQNRGYYFPDYKPFMHILQIRKLRNCMPENKPKCITEHRDIRMTGGFTILMRKEGDCLELCKKIANCAAVDWVKNLLCTFHHFEAPLLQDAGYVLYVMKDCSAVTTAAAAPPSTTKLEWPAKSAEYFLKTNSFNNCRYYRRRSFRNPESKQSILHCARQCCIKSCGGFTIFSKSSSHVCLHSDVNDPMYAPIIGKEW